MHSIQVSSSFARLLTSSDFPKKGILFFDCLPIFDNPGSFNLLVKPSTLDCAEPQLDLFESHLRPLNPTVVIGLDARGFIFAPALALRLNIRFVPVRKRGKLPGPTVQAEYVKEYGADIFEIQTHVLTSSDRVVVVDDLIATGNPSGSKVDGRWVCKSNGRFG